MGIVKLALGDAIITFMWVFCVSCTGIFTSIIASYLKFQGFYTLGITVFLVFSLVFIFSLIGEALGGASFNPSGLVAFHAAGFGKDSLFSLAIRFPAQAAGAVGGALAIMEVMPASYKNKLGGPSLKVELHKGAIAEGFLTFLISFAILFIIVKGPRNSLIKMWLLAMSTVTLVLAGSSYTGPAMNPANVVLDLTALDRLQLADLG
ncbi:aquaporin SIP1-2 isoform X2 [Amborella trichopoda]|uniref:aquaporin SIP1-2 isoform X2 n=1 Tax=Amborella trichopoda TaxID=13333 RepID=UPI0005D2FCCE|nr:aquaporin SIP1-2 isoform X2 [Amborella trichopoda]|eukprot:XP_011623776.1 aquaporin SIP1-2 isoform X2 [Amborella trichopoda]